MPYGSGTTVLGVPLRNSLPASTVAADERAPRDGRFIEKVGTYNPLLAADNAERVKLDEMRRTDAFERFSMRMSSLFDRYGVVPGLNRAGLDLAMKRMPME